MTRLPEPPTENFEPQGLREEPTIPSAQADWLALLGQQPGPNLPGDVGRGAL